MLQPVSVGTKSLADYTHLAGRPLIQEIRELAEPLEGLRVLHLSATAFGGGVAEILYTLIPLMTDVGIDAQWEVMLGREEFYNVTKRLHNALQGNPDSLSDEEWEIFDRYNERNAKDLSGDWDVIIVHDPQPVAMRQHVPDRAKSWVWRCHIDLSTPNPAAIDRIVPYVRDYDASVWHVQSTTCRRAWTARRQASTSARRRSTRCRRRTWRCRPRTPPSCATSSASTSTARCSARCHASTRGRIPWA